MDQSNSNGGQVLCMFTVLNAMISLIDFREFIQIGAGLMAIICGAFTSYYYHKKTKLLTKHKKNERS